MTTIVTRAGKGSPLTNTELDANFTNLKTTADAALPLSGGTLTGNLSLGDNVKLQLGNQTDGDLQIYHDGSRSYISDQGTGGLRLLTNEFSVKSPDESENLFFSVKDGSTYLYQNSSIKLQTTSSGISVTGSVVADGLTVSNTGVPQILIQDLDGTDKKTTLKHSNGTSVILSQNNFSHGTTLLQSSNGTTTLTRQKIDSNGDISFYNTAGTSQNLFWDSSTSRLGLGTTVPDVKLHISGTSGDAIMRLERNDNTITTNDVYGEIQFEGQDASAGSSSGIRGKIVGVAEDTTGAMGLSFETAGGYGSSTERLRIKGDGSSVFSGSVTSTGLTVNATGDAALLLQSSAASQTLRLDQNSIRTTTNTPINFLTNSTPALTLSTSQNVNIPNGKLGVGFTTVPSAPLHVDGSGRFDNSASTSVRLHINNSGSNDYASIYADTATAYKNLVLNPSGGNVGIGTDSPSANLDVTKTSSGNVVTNLMLRNPVSGAIGTGTKIYFSCVAGNNRGSYIESASGASNATYLAFATNNAGADATERMRIDSSGLVGIGKTPSHFRLDVQASATGGNVLRGMHGTAEFQLYQANNSHTFLGTANSADLVFITDTVERMRIDASGQVKIHTPITNGFFGLSLQYNNTDTADFKVNQATGQIKIGGSATGYYPTFWSNNTERMRIDSSGNVIVGGSDTGFAATKLKTGSYSTAESGINILTTSTGTGYLLFGDGTGAASYSGGIHYNHNTSSMSFRTLANHERMRIDSTGNLLVGTTDTTLWNDNADNYGHNILGHGQYYSSTNGEINAYLNRQNSDGAILALAKDGTGRGALSLISNDLCVHSTTSDHSGLRFANGAIHPTDNTGTASDSAQIDLGSGSYRFNDIYARNSTILTSDRNEKQDIEELSDAEQRVAVRAKGLLRKFKWKDAVAEKGDDARIHFGIVAQDLQAAFAAEGLDAGDYGVFISNTWTNEDGHEQTRMGVRYGELLAFIISAI